MPNHATEQTIPETTPTSLPTVTVIMPIRNEAVYIEQTVRTLQVQDYPADRLEILLVDGMSDDGTREILARLLAGNPDFNATMLDNPQQIVPTALNIALRHAQGEIIVRMDAHNEYEADYVRQVVTLRERTNADNAGGILIPVGTNYVQRAICSAFNSSISVGGSFQGHAVGGISGILSGEQEAGTHQDNQVNEVDTVHGGCWRRERLFEIGLFDESMVRNQDDELSFRLRKAGGTIVQSQGIQVRYHVRGSFRKLFKQFAQYGYWKIPVIRRHPKQASVRHAIPAIFVSSLFTLVVLTFFWKLAAWGLGALVVVYLTALVLAAIRTTGTRQWMLWPGVLLAIMVIHFGFGLGFLTGIARLVFGTLPTDAFFERTTR